MFKSLKGFREHDVVVHHQYGKLTRRQWLDRVERQALVFRARGLEPGDRVMLVLPNSLDILVATYACLAAGLLCVPVNARAAAFELARIAGHCQPRLCLAEPASLGKLKARLDCPVHSVSELETTGDAFPEHIVQDWPDEHPAMLYFTSGSTGEPKGVVYTHGTLRANSAMCRRAFGLTAADQSVLCHCMAHNFMFSQAAVPVLDAGGAVHIVDFGDVEQTASALCSGATMLMLIPWFAFDLVRCLRARGSRPPALRLCMVGGDRVPESLFEPLRQAMGIGVSQNIGMTETNTYSVDMAGSGNSKPGSVGLPLPGAQIAIRNTDGTACAADETGQIWVRSPGAMAGYWANDALTRETIREGWVATGDLGHIDLNGVLWFDARHRHMIIRDGDNIFPGEVERTIAQHPQVEQVSVFGVADERHGERVVAAVTMRDGLPLQADVMRAFLAERLSANKLPTEWLVLPKIPQNRNAKIDLQALRQYHEAQTDGVYAQHPL